VLDSDGQLRLIDPETLQLSRSEPSGPDTALVPLPSRSAAIHPWRALTIRRDGACNAIDNQFRVAGQLSAADVRLVRVQASESESIAALGIGMDSSGQWVAVGLDHDLNVQWRQAVGSQEFDSPVESLTRRSTREKELWAVAGSDASVSIFDAHGELVAQWQCPQPIRGIAWSSRRPESADPSGRGACELLVALESKLMALPIATR
jgi:hypothetical protein